MSTANDSRTGAARTVRIGTAVRVGPNQPLLLIAGPCQIESREHALRSAETLVGISKQFPINLVYKSSYDKANRTSGTSARGIGIDAGLRILEEIRANFGVPVLTDVHSPEQARAAGAVVDMIQTPAFLCRQTDLLLAAGETKCAVNIKKGQFLHPRDMRFAAEKVGSGGNHNILLCERGASFGYRDLVVDMRSLIIMREIGYPVIFDATHSVQSMGGADGASGGSREFVAPLARGAVAVGVDGVFIECHEQPDRAPSDGPSMLPFQELGALLAQVCRIQETARSGKI